MTEPEKPSVKSYVAAKLEEWFGAEFDSNKIRQAEAPHDQFNPSEGALFHPLFRHEAAVPRIPGLEPAEPSLLMHNLGKDKATDDMAPSYKYIAETKQKGPGALYGTSGAGKTRSVLEYLSYNKGLYLAAETEYGFRPAEPGSGDLSYVFRREHLKYLHEVDGDREKIDQSNINLDLVQQRVSTLLYIRHAVHEYVVTKLGVELSALGWLMLQLYPKHYFGEDIFASILINCIMDADLCNLRDTCDAAIREAKTNWKVIVIDESQVLLRRHTHYFCSSKDSKKARSGFAAILNSMLVVKITASRSGGVSIPFPLFAGTGMSIDEVDDEATSAIAKRLGVLEKRPYFTRFPTLDVEGVKSYMKRFLQLDVGVGEAVLDHIAKWLTGRPRWTATFLEEFFVRSPKPKNLTTKGFFEDNEKLMVQALDRYIHDMTELDRRQSWTGSNNTARTAIQKAMTTINNRETLNDLELALYHFTFGGNTHLITKSTKYLIEIGVARLKLAGTEDPDGNTYKVTVDEPLIVEAGIRHVGLNTLAKWGLKVRHNSNGECDSFEEIAVVALRSRLKEVLGTTFPDSNRLAKLSVPTKSSHGVMVKSCKGQGQEKIGDLLDWIDSATSATFEGSVPPFCFPCELFGPDVVCLLRDEDDYQKIGTVLCQVKFKKQQSQTDALRSIVPEWLFYERKDTTARAMNKNVSGPKLQRWKTDLESKLVGDSIPLVRCLVEFPANATRNSQSGRIHRNGIKLCKDPENCEQKLDWLLTVAGQEVDSLFDADFVDMFKAIKGDPQEKPKAGGKRKREQEDSKKKKASS